jgi:hypothetical protein
VADRIEAPPVTAADQAIGVRDQLAGRRAPPDREAVVPAGQRYRIGAVARPKLPQPVALGRALSRGAGCAGDDLAPGRFGEPGALELRGAVAGSIPGLGRAQRGQRRGEDPDRGNRGAAQASAMNG